MNSQGHNNYAGVTSNNLDICQRIPHCAESDGLADSCTVCEREFVIRIGICIKENNQSDQSERSTTGVSHCVAYNEGNQCV